MQSTSFREESLESSTSEETESSQLTDVFTKLMQETECMLEEDPKTFLSKSKDASNPAKFYMNSALAYVSYPTVHIKLEGEAEEGVVIVKDENKVELGTLEDSNHRIINKYIVTGQVESCQLAMGLTILDTYKA